MGRAQGARLLRWTLLSLFLGTFIPQNALALHQQWRLSKPVSLAPRRNAPLSLRGGGTGDTRPSAAEFSEFSEAKPQEKKMIESWSAMSAWVASKWEEIPTQEREKLQRFAVQVVDPEANVWLGKSTAVQVAMMLLALKVAQKMFPHWDELWRRLTGIVKDWQTSDPGPRAERVMIEAIEMYFSKASGASLQIGSLRLPTRDSNEVEIRDLVIGNPAGYHAGEAMRIESLKVRTKVRIADVMQGKLPLLVLEELSISGLHLSLRVGRLGALLRPSEAHTNLEAIAKNLDNYHKDVAKATAGKIGGKVPGPSAKMAAREMKTTNCSVGVGGADASSDLLRFGLGDLKLRDVGEEAKGGVAPEEMPSAVLKAVYKEVLASLKRTRPSGPPPSQAATDLLSSLHNSTAHVFQQAAGSQVQFMDAIQGLVSKVPLPPLVGGLGNFLQFGGSNADGAGSSPSQQREGEGQKPPDLHRLLSNLGLDAL
mmetsp:Transcript_10709/g.25539  ORF Transcript_10709/g.25539 Transcript_10709/m.25539 type:complete len:482 (+) Transcript_10709:55-1500(+)